MRFDMFSSWCKFWRFHCVVNVSAQTGLDFCMEKEYQFRFGWSTVPEFTSYGLLEI
jgi:hypothetical protein